jgi:hypothetical protein
MCQLLSTDHFKELNEKTGGPLIVLKPYRNAFSSFASLAIVILLASPCHLFGYADPGTGAFLYQALYAACIGGVFYFRKFLSRIFRKRP